MRNRTRLPAVALLSLFLPPLAMGSCSSAETDLSALLDDPSAIAVVKDKNDSYWAIPASGIDQIDENKISLKEGILIAKGTGSGPAAQVESELADRLVELLSRARPGQFGETSFNVSAGETTIKWTDSQGRPVTPPMAQEKGEPFDVSGRVEVTPKDAEIEVERIILTRSGV